MSVQMLDLKAFEGIAKKMWVATFKTQIDINYFECCRKLTEEQIRTYVKTWCQLNEWSYIFAYGKRDGKYTDQSQYNALSDFLDLRFSGPIPSTYQFLKWLQCLAYNIEMETIASGGWEREWGEQYIPNYEKEAYQFLEKLIKEASSAIIGTLPEYENAKWSDA